MSEIYRRIGCVNAGNYAGIHVNKRTYADSSHLLYKRAIISLTQSDHLFKNNFRYFPCVPFLLRKKRKVVWVPSFRPFTNSDQYSFQICLCQMDISAFFGQNKVSKGAKIRNRYNQVPHLTQDTNGKVTNSQSDTTNESQEVSPFPAGDHKAQINRRALMYSKHKTEKNS